MKKIVMVISVVLLAVLCVSLAACGNTTTIKAEVKKYGEVQYISVSYGVVAGSFDVYKEQPEIDKIVNFFDNARFELKKDMSEESIISSNVMNYSVSIGFETSLHNDSFSIIVCADGTTYLTTNDGIYLLKGTTDVEVMKKFLETI